MSQRCSQRRRGNLFDRGPAEILERGPYVGSVERECTAEDGSTYEKHYASFASNIKPSDPNAVARSLERSVDQSGNGNGIFNDVANMIKNVFGVREQKSSERLESIPSAKIESPQSQRQQHRQQQQSAQFQLHDQQWPSPQIEELADDIVQSAGRRKRSAAAVSGSSGINRRRKSSKRRRSSAAKRSKKRSGNKSTTRHK